MTIDANTKTIARLHKKPSPRGLNIYNPFFQETGLNAVYLLFHNLDPKPLITGLRNLNLNGAITAGFESDPTLPELLDDLDPVAKYVGKIGFLKNINGKLRGYYQGGPGLLSSITSLTSIENKHLVIVGGGTLAKGLLFAISQTKTPPAKVSIFNRTLAKIEHLKTDFKFVQMAGALEDLNHAVGDIFINASDIGGSVTDYHFAEDLIKNFSAVIDVTFETEMTPLLATAKKLNIPFATGWDFFTHQGRVFLKNYLKQKSILTFLKNTSVPG